MKPACLAAAISCLALQALGADAPRTDVRWTCGGIGSDERRALEAHRASARLELTFVTAKRGGYVAGAHVTIHRDGTLLAEFDADGPICLVDAPAGSYRIEARSHDAASTRTVRLAAAGASQRAVFTFPEERSDGIEASDEEKRQARSP